MRDELRIGTQMGANTHVFQQGNEHFALSWCKQSYD